MDEVNTNIIESNDNVAGAGAGAAGALGAYALIAAATSTTGSAVLGATMAGTAIGVAAVSAPVWIVVGVGAAVVGGITYGIMKVIPDVRVLGPGAGTEMTTLQIEQWYEVRYYSPYIKDINNYEDGYVFNSIKIVPYDMAGEGTQVGGGAQS